jgi:hypothetical protein
MLTAIFRVQSHARRPKLRGQKPAIFTQKTTNNEYLV